ncbi:hypothetical protein [Vibrio cincinnatiensis]
MASELSGMSKLETAIGRVAVRSAIQAGGNYLTNTLLEGHSNFSWKALLLALLLDTMPGRKC